MANIGSRISYARRRKGYTQEALGREIEVPQPYISWWETGKVEPSEHHIARLEEALGPLNDLSARIRDAMDRYQMSVPDIAWEANLTPPPIYNILKKDNYKPQRGTVEKIEIALAGLRDQHENNDSDGEGDDEEGEESSRPMFLSEEGIGEKIKSVRLF